ncbi:hypothetical protein TSOC_012987 [Tetrabaena socialis]|uniref:Uncharacterized protein n=1 Tax=Tetrabaena socialis TaxID=47790 RepID=A0A2J7ZLJ7_9CHLO|nr:hypothetical protein TSOC_012987 [Tetrabaena socialis]|eukprot:PNH01141.1 hypothetical protein TSOC_012987 [Tetrabaena socialis]
MVAGANELPLAEEHKAATGSDLVSLESVGWAAAVLLSRASSLDLAVEGEEEDEAGEAEERGSAQEALPLALTGGQMFGPQGQGNRND